MRQILWCLAFFCLWETAQALTLQEWSPETQSQIERVRTKTLDEHTLYDKNKTYRLTQLTKTPQGSYIVASPADTLEFGKHDVLILDDNDRIIKRLTGYFMDGYYIGNTPLKAKIIKRYSPRKDYQEAFYFLQSDDTLKIFFIGKMISFVKDGQYTDFNLCRPFQMVLLTENKALFQNPATLKNIVSIVKSYASTVCPDVKSFVFSASDNPQHYEEDIFFQTFYNKNEKGDWVEDTRYTVNNLPRPITSEALSTHDQPARYFNERGIDFPIHLLKAAQVTGKPMEGTFIVHIAKLDMQNAWIDYPFPMALSSARSTGWALIKGIITPMSDKEKRRAGISLQQEAAHVQLLKIKNCQQDYCQDLHLAAPATNQQGGQTR